MNKLITMLCAATVAAVSFADVGAWFTENKTTVGAMKADGKTTDGTWAATGGTLADTIFVEGDNVGFEIEDMLSYTPNSTMKGETATVTVNDMTFGAVYASTADLPTPEKTGIAIVGSTFYIYGAKGEAEAAWNDTEITADPDAQYTIAIAVNGSTATYTIGENDPFTVNFAGAITELALKGSGSFASLTATKAFADFNLTLPAVTAPITGWQVDGVDYEAGVTKVREGKDYTITALVDPAYNVKYPGGAWVLNAAKAEDAVIDDYTGKMVVAKNPAKIGDTYYETLDLAVAAALANETDNQTITLCDTVTYATSAGPIIDAGTATISKHLTLDLGDYDIVANGSSYGLIVYGVELTVKGSGSIVKNNAGSHVLVGFSTQSSSELTPKADSTRATPVYANFILESGTIELNGSSNSTIKVACGTAQLKGGKVTGTRPAVDGKFSVITIDNENATLDFADFGCDVADVKKWNNDGTVKIYSLTEATQKYLLANVAGKYVAGKKFTVAETSFCQLQEGTELTVTADPTSIAIYDDYVAANNTPVEEDLIKWGADLEKKNYSINAVFGFQGTIKEGADVTVAGTSAEKIAWLLLKDTTLDGTLRIDGATSNFSFLDNGTAGAGANLYLTLNGKFYFGDEKKSNPYAEFRAQWMSAWGLSTGCEILPAPAYAATHEVVYKDGAYQLAEKTSEGPSPADGNNSEVTKIEDNVYQVEPTEGNDGTVAVQGVQSGDTIVVTNSAVTAIGLDSYEGVTIKIMNNGFDITGACVGKPAESITFSTELDGNKYVDVPGESEPVKVQPTMVEAAESEGTIADGTVATRAIPGLTYKLVRLENPGDDPTVAGTLVDTEAAETSTVTLKDETTKPADKAFYVIEVTK